QPVEPAYLPAHRLQRSPPEVADHARGAVRDEHDHETRPVEELVEQEDGHCVRDGGERVAREEVAQPVEGVRPEAVPEERLLEVEARALAGGPALKPAPQPGHAQSRACSSDTSPHSPLTVR